MEGGLQMSPQLGYHVDSADAKYVSGLSTILVATIQETKDRISQIEYIFCSQLFPNFQSKSKGLQKVYSEARKDAEDAWKEKEKDLLLQIEKLQFEKQHALEENQSLKLEKAKLEKTEGPASKCFNQLQEELKQKTKEVAEGRELQQNLLNLLDSKGSEILNNEKMVKELEEKNKLLLKNIRSLGLEAEELQLEVMKRSTEVDAVMEQKTKLLQLVQSKVSLIGHKENQLKEHGENTTGLLAKLKSTEEKVDALQCELREKTKQIDRGKELQENLLKKIELQASERVKNEQLLNDYENEKRLLTAKLEHLEGNVDGLQKKLGKKVEEVEEGRKMQEQLLQQIDSRGSERLKTEQELEELQKEKRLLLAKLKVLEEKVYKLQMHLRERSNESTEGMELHGKLLQQIEAKDTELLFEKKKRRDAVDAFKKLKSQYNFLCAKFGLTTENMLPQNRIEDEHDSLRQNQNPLTSPGIEHKVQDAFVVACELTKKNDNQDNMEVDKGVGLVQQSSSNSPSSSSSPLAPANLTNVKSGSLAGTKRPVSHWIGTRSHQNRGGCDPHDDFLDTPLENVRGNLKKATKEEFLDLPNQVSKDMNFGSSDDETQDINVDLGPQKQQMPPPRPGTRGFKYVEPVRKKVERENLKGIECKQCKKFYDAVLPDGKDTDGNKQNLRCEHHDGVSRHRYRYAPPLTPEGFWNIGFESEM